MSLELRGITKTFGSLIANDSIDLQVADGEILAILGENGAGKSTLMNVVYGLLQPDSGSISVNGKTLSIHSPLDALEAGIGMVHQHFMLIPVFTVVENIVLGNEKTTRAGLLSLDKAREEIRRISDEFNFAVDPDALVEDLPVGIQQRVEIIRALIYDAQVLILDEPTAVLTPQETDELLRNLKKLRESGRSIVFISHKLREVKAIADKITIIRRGKVVGNALPTASQEELANLMVGREVDLKVDKGAQKSGDAVVLVKNFSHLDHYGRPIVDDVSFEVKAGEILAIAGVQGNGQSELAESFLGLQEVTRGSITVAGHDVLKNSVLDNLRSGIAYIPEDREKDGLISSFSIAENLILDIYQNKPFSSNGLYFPERVDENARARVSEFDVRTQSIYESASSLSGGNKQKVVIARELSRPVNLVIACQPTRGLDVGSIEFVHKRLVEERDQGRAVIVFSTELDEVFALADRIAIMFKGRIIAIVPATESRENIGLYMAGLTPGGTSNA
jgi:simple sugar transport system ATP-binding protein